MTLDETTMGTLHAAAAAVELVTNCRLVIAIVQAPPNRNLVVFPPSVFWARYILSHSFPLYD
jgi:hypothetical protein